MQVRLQRLPFSIICSEDEQFEEILTKVLFCSCSLFFNRKTLHFMLLRSRHMYAIGTICLLVSPVVTFDFSELGEQTEVWGKIQLQDLEKPKLVQSKSFGTCIQ